MEFEKKKRVKCDIVPFFTGAFKLVQLTRTEIMDLHQSEFRFLFS